MRGPTFPSSRETASNPRGRLVPGCADPEVCPFSAEGKAAFSDDRAADDSELRYGPCT
ncbi:hypothetical protein AZA_37421 [Nitrospirillum viridazoti Y2]|nr:hypothetical protein AZA_37421 [Nitrospirillum amazonense Y2]